MRLLFIFSITLILALTNLKAFAQDIEEPVDGLPFANRLFLGGNFGLQFGSITFINISPLIGYRITDRLSAGPGVSYMYYSDWTGYNTHIYGGRIFTMYNILQSVFLYGEYEILNLDRFGFQERIDVTNILLGGGFRQSIGGRAFWNIMGLWNINESVYSPYSNPIFRMGVTWGL
jgi:long-subunit fatty acid transport protein